jgi:hypothetical protein
MTCLIIYSIPKELGQMTSVTKQPGPVAPSNGFENVD